MKFLKSFLKLIHEEINVLFMTLIAELPNSYLGSQIRSYYWAIFLKLPRFKVIGRGVYIYSKDKLSVGNNFEIGTHSTIDNNNSLGIFIGNNVVFARGVYLRTANHNFSDINEPINMQGHNFKSVNFNNSKYSVVIEDNVWIGANVIILSGSHIGCGSILGAGSIVTGFLPAYSVCAGNPARVLYSRKVLI